MDELLDTLQYAKEWLAFSDMDIKSAEHLLTMQPVPDEVICYLSQQCAEKSLKGFIVFNNKTPPKTHNLLDLCLIGEAHNSEIKSLLPQLEYLNQFSVMPRYPRELSINDQDTQNAIRYAKIVYDFILKCMA
jgi:HEPN domain-containing protein